MRPGRSADELFQIVSRYAAFGHHRTGSAVDHATTDWIASELRSCGLQIRAESVAFDGWECEATLRIDDRLVRCLGVPYEWQGSIDTTNVAIVDLQQGLGGNSAVLSEPVRAAKAAGFDAVVCATRHPTGALVGINRGRSDAALEFPVFLVAGAELAALQSSVVHVTASAHTAAMTTTNLTADNGGSGPRLMLTTPLTGWFTCAGERGTGIAVLLDLVTRFVDDRGLLVVVTGGHELGFFGAHEWRAARQLESSDFRSAISSIFHIGASVGVERDGDLIAQRVALTSVSEDACAPIRHALQPIGLALTTSPTRWVGEGEVWEQVGPPLLSTTGAGLDFHTPNDVAGRVTSPTALARVAESFASAVVALDDPMRA